MTPRKIEDAYASSDFTIQQRVYHRRLEKGLCIRCGGQNTNLAFKHCDTCKEYQRIKANERYHAKVKPMEGGV